MPGQGILQLQLEVVTPLLQNPAVGEKLVGGGVDIGGFDLQVAGSGVAGLGLEGVGTGEKFIVVGSLQAQIVRKEVGVLQMGQMTLLQVVMTVEIPDPDLFTAEVPVEIGPHGVVAVEIGIGGDREGDIAPVLAHPRRVDLQRESGVVEAVAVGIFELSVDRGPLNGEGELQVVRMVPVTVITVAHVIETDPEHPGTLHPAGVVPVPATVEIFLSGIEAFEGLPSATLVGVLPRLRDPAVGSGQLLFQHDLSDLPDSLPVAELLETFQALRITFHPQKQIGLVLQRLFGAVTVVECLAKAVGAGEIPTPDLGFDPGRQHIVVGLQKFGNDGTAPVFQVPDDLGGVDLTVEFLFGIEGVDQFIGGIDLFVPESEFGVKPPMDGVGASLIERLGERIGGGDFSFTYQLIDRSDGTGLGRDGRIAILSSLCRFRLDPAHRQREYQADSDIRSSSHGQNDHAPPLFRLTSL